MLNLPNSSGTTLFRRIAGFITTLAVIAMVLMFSAVVFAVILIAGSISLAYVWWKTRNLRKQVNNVSFRDAVMESEVARQEFARGDVIEGEAVRVSEARDIRPL